MEIKKSKNTVLAFSDYLFCALLAPAMTASSDYIQTGSFSPSVGYFPAAFALFAALLLAAFVLRSFLTKVPDHSAPERGVFRLVRRVMESRFHVVIIALLIFVCWLPALWFLYPGTCINDTWGQWIQFIRFRGGEPVLSDHHPIFDTFLLGYMIVPFSQRTGEWHYAIFFYVLLQSFLTSLAFSCTVDFVYRKLKSDIRIVTFMILFYCLLPIYPASTQTVSKDALFSWIYVFFTIAYIEIVRSQGESLKKGAFLVWLSFLTVLCCLTKKIGIYVMIPSLVILFLFIRKNRLFLLIPAAAVVLVMYGILPPIFAKLEVQPGGQQEKYSLPFQMTARYLRDYGEDVTEEEYTVIDKVLNADIIADDYDPTWADPVKRHHQKGANEDFPPYLKVWLQMGLRHPDAYIAAANSMLAGWFSWTEYAPLMDMEHRNQLDSRYIPKTVAIRYVSKETAPSYKMMFDKLYENPFTRLFFTYGFYASLLPAFFAATILRKWNNGNRSWLAFIPFFLSLLFGCWMAPASIHLEGMRYLYPITYTIPIMFVYCAYIYKNSADSRQ